MIHGQSVANCEYLTAQLNGGGTLYRSTSFTHASLIANGLELASGHTAIRSLLGNGYLQNSSNFIFGYIPIFGYNTKNLNYVDNLSKIQQFFGVNVYQNNKVIIIEKSDLKYLKSLKNNTAESLFVALLKQQLLNVNQLDSLVNVEYYNTYFDRENKKRTMAYEIHCFTLASIVENEIQESSDNLSPDEF